MAFTRGKLTSATLLLGLVAVTAGAAGPGRLHANESANHSVTSIGVEHGLPTAEVRSIVEDASGVMWFATSGGLTHWTGTAAVSHRSPDRGPAGTTVQSHGNGLVADPVSGVWAASGQLTHVELWSGAMTVLPINADRIVPSGDDAIWLWHPGVIERFDLVSRSVVETFPLDVVALRPGEVPLGSDDDGRLFVGTRTGVTVIEPGGATTTWTIPSGISAVTAGADGGLLAAGESGLWRIDHAKRPVRLASLAGDAPTTAPKWTPSSALLERADGTIWLGDMGGLVHVYDNESWSVSSVARFDLTGEILAITEDSVGGLWVSESGSGILHIDDQPALFEVIETPAQTNTWGASWSITDIAHTNGALIAATRGSGLHQFDLTTRRWAPFTIDASALREGDEILQALQHPSSVAVSDDVIWVGTWGDGLHHIRGDAHQVNRAISSDSDFIYDLVPGADGAVWASTWGSGVQRFDQYGSVRNRLSTDSQLSIGNTWVRSILPMGHRVAIGGDAGLDIADLTAETTQSFSNADGTLQGREVLDIHAESDHVVWLVTDAGLERIDIDSGSAEFFGTDAGLRADRLIALTAHEIDNSLWLIFDRSVALFDLGTNTVTSSFNSSAGLPTSQFNAGALTTAGNVRYLAATTGIAQLPSKIAAIDATDHRVFTRCTDGCGGDYDGKHANGYGDDAEVTFEFFATGNSASAGAELEYRLAPHEAEWVRPAPGTQTVTYRGLEVGTYRFEARLVASGSEPVVTTAADAAGGSIVLTVSREWWRARSVQVSAALAVLLTAALFISMRTRRSRRHAAHLAGLVEERTTELRQTTQEAQEANDAKTRFLSMVTHEFRSPLTSVMGYADLLESAGGPARQAEWAAAIRLAGVHLQAMIDDVLHFTAQESSAIEPRHEATRLGGLCHEIIDMLSGEAHRSLMVLTAGIDERVAETGYSVDQGRLRQVLINLTANALRHSNGRELVLRISVAHRGRDNDILHFAVTDDGDGLNAAELTGIFEPWHRGSDAAGPGLGLGLTISREIVAMLGGELSLDLSAGVTQFGFELELERVIVADSAQGASTKILIVDDDEFSLQVVGELLSALGYRVNAVDSARAALAALEIDRPAAILTDLMMPAMSGQEFARAVRSDSRWDSIPVAAMTGVPNPEAIRGPFDDVLVKPFGLARLRQMMSGLGVSAPVGDAAGSDQPADNPTDRASQSLQ